MDDIINPVGNGLGAQQGGWQDPRRDVLNPSDRGVNDNLDSDLVPLPEDDLDDLDDDEGISDLTDPMGEQDANYGELGDDDEEITPPDPANPEIGDDRGRRIIEDPMMDEDPAEDPEITLR